MQEIWKDVKGYEGLYKVSNLGNVLSLNYHRMKINKLKKFTLNHKGYFTVHLCNNKKNKRILVHRLVALAFIPNPNKLPQINHKDGDKQNNKVDNLEWCTNGENQLHAYNLGLKQPLNGTNNPSHKKINQYDIYGNFIRSWSYIKEASNSLNITASSITFCCQHKYKTAGGFVWEYAD